jgi:hypothetical protein
VIGHVPEVANRLAAVKVAETERQTVLVTTCRRQLTLGARAPSFQQHGRRARDIIVDDVIPRADGQPGQHLVSGDCDGNGNILSFSRMNN